MIRCRCEFRDLGGRSSSRFFPTSHVACRVPIIARSWTASSGGFASTRPGRIFLSATDLRQPILALGGQRRRANATYEMPCFPFSLIRSSAILARALHQRSDRSRMDDASTQQEAENNAAAGAPLLRNLLGLPRLHRSLPDPVGSAGPNLPAISRAARAVGA